MILTLIFLAAIGVIVLAERSVEHLLFAIAALSLNVAVFLFIVADFERAILLSCILAVAIAAASTVKYNHSALKLIVTDLPLVFAGTVPFFVQYPRAVLAVLAGSVVLILASTAVLIYAAGSPISLEVRVLLFSLALVGFATAYRISGGAASFRLTLAERRCFYSTFIASLIDPVSWRQFGGLGSERYRK